MARVDGITFSVIHDRVPGRLRIAVDGVFRSAARASEVASKLRGARGVLSVQASSHTGRVLVAFDPGLAHARVVRDIHIALQPAAVAKSRTVGTRAATSAQRKRKPPNSASPAARRRRVSAATSPPGRAPGAGSEGTWHTYPLADILARLEVDPCVGLSPETARKRLASAGRNLIEERPPPSRLLMLARQFTSLPVGMLMAAAGTSLLTGGLVDALATIAVVGANAAVGYTTESGSERLIRSMTSPQRHLVSVLRGGKVVQVEQAEIVPGDILALTPSTVIAADARLIEGSDLAVNEALLTGESEPVEKMAHAVLEATAPIAERLNMLHKGSFVISGSGRAAVVATGAGTEVGRIDAATRGIETPRTRLETDLENLGSKLAVVSLIACGGFFAAGALRGRPMASMFKSALALAVASVPEGLPVTATTTLALGLQNLRQHGVVVRRLEAVEGLGSLHVVCFDKTGTLTENRMQLAQAHVGPEAVIVDLLEPGQHTDARAPLDVMGEIAVLCSEVEFAGDADGWRGNGSSTETALAQLALRQGTDPLALRAAWPLLQLDQRTEARRYMRSLHGPVGEENYLAVKGDPHQVLAMCRSVLDADGRVLPLTERDRSRIDGTTDELAGRGLRVLGFAMCKGRRLDPASAHLTWAGAAGLKDPVAPGVKALISRLRTAGVRPIMITGDQAATAVAIASEVGLNGSSPIRVLDARAIENLSPQVLDGVAGQVDVFARVPPTQKLRIVEALRRGGAVVGMSGDGFNDAPALRAADIAIAVGQDSASAARDVADVIVKAGHLASVADGVEQGRTILSNIRKSVHFMISTNLSEIMVLIAESLIARDELETPLELLWLNLVTDLLPGLGLALEPPERNVMSQSPRPANEPLLTVRDLRVSALESMVIAGSVLGAHAYGLSRYGPGPQTRAVTFTSLVASQLLHALACRHDRFEPLGGRSLFGNSALNMALLGSAGLQAIALASPAARGLLGIGAPSLLDLAVAAASGIASFAVNETLLAMRTGPPPPAWPT